VLVPLAVASIVSIFLSSWEFTRVTAVRSRAASSRQQYLNLRTVNLESLLCVIVCPSRRKRSRSRNRPLNNVTGPEPSCNSAYGCRGEPIGSLQGYSSIFLALCRDQVRPCSMKALLPLFLCIEMLSAPIGEPSTSIRLDLT